MTREQIAKEWEAQKNGTAVSTQALLFYNHYYSFMENWRYALKNVAF